MTEKFFEERKEQSEAKARIITKYFFAWARVIMPTAEQRGGKIAYIDLYAGPGRYKDGAESTPLYILRTAINHPKISQMLVSYFNDAESANTRALEEEIRKFPDINRLKYAPVIRCGAVDDEAEHYFNETRLIPAFSFIDPFGYKGLSSKIVKGVIKDWGCDCVFFFNYNRINAGISNEIVTPHIDALFSKTRADKLRGTLPGLPPDLREAAILEELANEIKDLGGRYVLPFTFKNAAGSRTSHKLIFVSKNFKGYEIMKDIMAKESSTEDEGVPSFTYSPADASMPLLFSLAQPLSKLRKSLLMKFAGQEVTLNHIYQTHSVDTPYVKKNYKAVIEELEEGGVVSVNSTKGKRRRGTYPDHVLIKFPEGAADGD
ncbi:three-Cys-motif partner protein TcmP [Fodinicurvata sediminis]|uniref:three-Cys-motif partner protein TcmP n=1 Tax=Fodinicurvata sediminis TaxID=1121832 RepID=UPI0003B622D9|nr:three-Cys-motif partner protein TcmP [Fodinicurvata sediminis]